MNADETRRGLERRRQRGDRQGRRVGAEDRVFADHGLRLGDRLFLDLAILEHRLDDKIAIRQCRVVRRRRDAREQRIAIGGRCAAAVDLIGDQLLRMRLALVGGFLIAIDEDDVDAGLRGDIGDAGAHEARAEDADLLDRLRRHVCRPPRAFVEVLHGNEQRADHRRRLGRAEDFREIARFHPQRLIHRKLQALIDHLQDGARRRIIVVGLAAVERVRRREHHHAILGIDQAAGKLETVDVPRRLRRAAGLDPVLGRLHQIRLRHHRVDKLHRLGAIEPKLIALEQKLQSVRRLQHARDPLRAATAGKQADFDFRQAKSRLIAVGGDTVMTGERQFEAAAHGGAVERRHPGLPARLHAAGDLRKLAAFVEQPLVCGFLAL